LSEGSGPFREQFERHLALIEDVIRKICRRQCLDEHEAEDFFSSAMIKLMEDDFAVLRKFRGEASLKGYLFTVLNAHFLNFRDQRWGKWRPSAAAVRLGPEAVLLERLTTRDGHSFDEAAEIMRANHGSALSTEELAALAAELPNRLPRRFEGEEAVAQLSVDGAAAERALANRESAPLAAKLAKTLSAELARMTPEDRMLLRLRFHDGLSVAAIARVHGGEQRKLYQRLYKLAGQLRKRLERDSIMDREVIELLDNGGFQLHIDFGSENFSGRLSC